MAACGSLTHIFEKPLPETPSLLESLSWNQIKPIKPIEQSSFTELFGELHFKENSFIDLISHTSPEKEHESKKTPSPDSFSVSSKKNNYESLQLCTEGLGFESSDDVEDLMDGISGDQSEKVCVTRGYSSENPPMRCRSGGGAFPPSISSIGKSGKPSVSFLSYRQDGRFILKQVRIPRQEFLHARREDGRLQLHFVQPSDEILEEDVEDEDESCIEESDDSNFEKQQISGQFTGNHH